MGRMLTLTADISVRSLATRVPEGYVLRPCRAPDVADLGRLYFESYEPGIACSGLSEAVADMEATFAGEYGELWREASLAAVDQRQQLVAAIQVVRWAPWTDTPDGPFVIELFTARPHRRRGLARALLERAMRVVAAANATHLALRVDEDNVPALALYRGLGFRAWTAECIDAT